MDTLVLFPKILNNSSCVLLVTSSGGNMYNATLIALKLKIADLFIMKTKILLHETILNSL